MDLWCFNCAGWLENNMISLERCVKYTKVKGEKPGEIKEKDDELRCCLNQNKNNAVHIRR